MSTEPILFKDLFTKTFINGFGQVVQQLLPAFDKEKFAQKVFDIEWGDKELKQRMRHITHTLHHFLPASFPETAKLLVKIVDSLQENGVREDSLTYIFLPDYVEVYGIEHFSASAKAIEHITQFVSCEFAVRPFILKYEERMLQQMITWGNHKSHKVRRLASEGSRPRLPWAIALPTLKKDPTSILPLLEKLKDDESEWVRRSVANNLNDISKDNPEIVLNLFKKWHGKSKETDWVIKHGSRTLLKQGHTELLALFGFDQDGSASILRMAVETPVVKWSGDLIFSLTIKNKSKTPKKIRLEYGMYYKKANGSLSKKVFKISEREYAPGETCNITRKQSFRPITTRVYHFGPHKVSVIVNGHEKAIADFILQKPGNA